MFNFVIFQLLTILELLCNYLPSSLLLKITLKQWYLKFDKIIAQNGFKKNTVDGCIYLRVSGSSYIFLVLYVDNILLASNDYDLLIETKHMLSTHFDMKDLGEASYVLDIKIIRDRANGVLKLSQRAYIEKIWWGSICTTVVWYCFCCGHVGKVLEQSWESTLESC